MNYQVLDNFLSEEDFFELEKGMINGDFPWYFNSAIVGGELLEQEKKEPSKFQFVHSFYNEYGVNSGGFELLSPILEKIGVQKLFRIKANLIPRTEEIIEHGFHTDYDPEKLKCLTAVFYLNTNDGYTIFADGTKVESVANRLLMFDSDLSHSGTSCTNEKIRVVINFNYRI